MNLDQPGTVIVTCAPGLTPYLKQELEGLGIAIGQEHRSDIQITATLRDCLRLNLHLRTAFAVQYLLGEFPCNGPNELYEETRKIPWETIIPADGYVTITSRAVHPTLHSWTFANLKVKDAIVDRIAELCGSRPDSGPDRKGVVVHLEWQGERAALFLNTSGQKLADRGYRRMPHKAPMQETLAAAVVMATGYTGDQPLANPMCGSGTLAIEAALIATRRPPGLLRSNFGILQTKDFDRESWEAIRREAQKQRRKDPPAKIIATDRDPRAIAAATQNAKTAGVDHLIEFAVCEFAETTIPPGPGIVLLNPEYGERLGEVTALEETYAAIGDFFKQRCPGYTGYIFTGNLDLAKKVGLRAGRRIEFWNAKIDCRLLKYELFQGTRGW